MINIPTFLCNENFYEKLALTFAIIRSTPSHFTPKEFAIQLQNIYRRKKNHERVYFEQISSELHSLRQSHAMVIPSQPLESHLNFLQILLLHSIDLNIEIQTIVLETIDRIVDFIEKNLARIEQSSYQTLFRQAINTILNYHLMPNIHKHLIEHIEQLLRLLLMYMKKQTSATADMQIFIEQIDMENENFIRRLTRFFRMSSFVFFISLSINSIGIVTLFRSIDH